MAEAFIEGRPWSETVNHPAKLRAVTRDDVMRVAKTYLSDAPVVIRRVRGEFEAPKVEKPSISPIAIDSSKASSYAKQIKAMPVEPLKPQWLLVDDHYQHSKLPAGDLLAVKNSRNDLFTVSYVFKLGEQQSPLLCFALDLVERGGAGKRSPAELRKALYAIGSSISFACDTRESAIYVSGVDRKMEESLALLREWLSAPLVDAATLENSEPTRSADGKTR